MKYSYIILILIILSIVVFNILNKKNTIGFQNYNTQKWSPDLIRRFNIYQTTVNNNANQFNLDLLQQQATPDEAEELIRTGFWPWPNELKYLYLEKVWSNPIIKIQPQYALNYAMKLYNKNAVTQLLAWNTKEGQFLLYGGDLGVSDGMPKNVHNSIKCVAKDDSTNNFVLQKKIYTGMNLWNGYMNYTTTTINPEDIPKQMPGFSFVKEPCNPCVALNSPQDFSCPFKLNVKENIPLVKENIPLVKENIPLVKENIPLVKGDDSITEPWKRLWQI